MRRRFPIPKHLLSPTPRIRLRVWLLGWLLACLLPGGTAGAQELLQLNFGVYSANKPSTMVTLFKPALQAIEQSMAETLSRPVEIRMQIAPTLEEATDLLANGEFDFSRLGPSSYVRAKRANEDIDILGVEKLHDDARFFGIIVVQASSDINDISELAGGDFAFGDEGSTIGRYLSQRYLMNNGITAGDLEHYEYLGRNDKVGTAVAAGMFTAGALDEDTFQSLVGNGENLRELARFADVTQPWVARSGLSVEIVSALRAAMFTLTDSPVLEYLNIGGFLPGNDADYEAIRLAMEDNYRFFEESPVSEAAPATDLTSTPAPVSEADVTPAIPAPPALEPPLARGVPVPSALRVSADTVAITVRLPAALLAPASQASRARQLTINLEIDEAGNLEATTAMNFEPPLDVETPLPDAAIDAPPTQPGQPSTPAGAVTGQSGL